MCQRTHKYTSTKKYVFDRLVHIFISTLLIVTLSPHSTAFAVQVTLGWDPPADGSVVSGYRVYSRVEGQSYNSQPRWQGTTTTCTIADLHAVTTYFVARAYNSYGESGNSNEVTYQPSISPAISRNPASLSPSCVQGVNASSQTFQVSNSGGGTLSYTISDNATWLSCSPSSGSSTGEQDTVTVTYATSALSAGTYSATITIAATGATNTPQTIPVSLKVSEPSVQSGAAEIPQAGWRLLYVDSQELVAENGAAVNAFDGNESSFWHTEWYRNDPSPPHEIQIDLGQSYKISGFWYLPRQDGGINGTIRQYEFYVSTDGRNWGVAAASGTFAADTTEKEVSFAPRTGRYVRLRALSEVNGNPWTSAAEINVRGSP